MSRTGFLLGASAAGLVAAIGAAPHVARAQDGSPASESEVIVTAQKKEERLMDTPVSVTAVQAQRLVESAKVKLRDFSAQIPGLDVQPGNTAQNFLTIRGITNVANATVGVTVDDVPYGGATVYTGANIVPDLDPGDLERIEVLRGPQGTLYGANTLAGLIKYVTKDPSTAGFSGRAEGGVGGIQNGDGPSYNVRGSVNIPVGDRLAYRASAFWRHDPGYIDNPVLGLKGVNEWRTFGARISGLFKPSESSYVKLGALYQRTDAVGPNEVNIRPGLGDLQQNYVKDGGRFSQTTALYTANVGLRFAGVQLVSVTGFAHNGQHTKIDDTYLAGARSQAAFGVSGAIGTNNRPVNRITQEIRLSSTLWRRFDWQLGGFYSHEKSSSHQGLFAADPASGRIVGQFWDYFSPGQVYDEYAVFGNLTWRLTDRFDILGGFRETHFKTAFAAINQSGTFGASGPGVGQNPTTAPEVDGSGDAFTYLVTPRYRFSPEFMVYARIASGYRPGGVNTAAVRAQGAPPTYAPDKTQSYELGAKGDFMQGRLTLDASLYYIDWTNIQLGLTAPGGFFYTGNGSGAKSQGFELSVTTRPLTGLSVEGWIAYTDAVLTEDIKNSPTHGLAGDRLPNSPRWSGHVALEQEFPLGRATGYVGGELSLIGDRWSVFTGSALRQVFPAYAKADLHAGARSGPWTFNLYVNNVTDKRAAVQGGIGYFEPNTFIYITPRNFGLNVSRVF
jgi:outer membrane receptor protein involved in Fe transport